jgi:TonB-linked SusC/RagA family outer membrane protein
MLFFKHPKGVKDKYWLYKPLLIMKLTLALIVFLNLQVVARVYSQTNVTLNVKAADFKKVVSIIEKQSVYRFVFSERKFPALKKFDLDVQDAPVKDVVNNMLDNSGYAFKEIGDHLIVITPANVNNSSNAATVTGKVVDEKGLPLPGVTVKVQGNPNLGAVTDVNGVFNINVATTATLELSYIGYLSKIVAINGQTTLNIALEPSAKGLNEVVVVGYGTQKKADLTGAVATVSGKDINWKPVGQVSNTLQGVVSGVTVTQGTGQPGVDQGTIRIRGIGTLNNNNPLVLVDGNQTDINNVDANDIASMSVLKDAAAASIYGVRAANGVILITTKRGESGKVKVSYGDYFGWQKTTRLSQFVGAQEFMTLANLMYTNSGAGAVYSATQIAAYNDPNRDLNTYPDNNWLKLIQTGSGFQQQHSLAVSGGGEATKYRFSANYFDQNGLIKNMNYDRLTVRLNTDTKISKRLTFSTDIAANISGQVEPQGVGGSAYYQFGQAFVANPLNVNQYTDGTWSTLRGGQNPIRLQDEGGLYNYDIKLFQGNFKANYEIIDGLTLSGIATDNYQSTYNSTHNKALDYTLYDSKATLTLGQNDITKEYIGYLFQNYQGLLQYKKKFGLHAISAFAGASRLSENYDDLTAYRKDIADADLDQLNAGSASTATNGGTTTQYVLQSYFGRLNYAYDDKYLLEANIRRDGSSRFPKGSNWGWFPSFSAGWNISREDFLKDSNWLQELKLRGSWGKLGNDNPLQSTGGAISNYPYQSTFSYNYSYPFGGNLNTAAYQAIYTNNNLTWETTTMTDIGFDMTVLKGRLNFVFDYYKKNTDNILYALPIPQTVGLGASYQNAGAMENRGFEFAVNYNGNIGKDFKYTIGANISDVKNKITDLKGTDYLSTDANNITTGFMTGIPYGAYYGYQSEGIFQTAAQVSSHATQTAGTAPGDLMYKDQNGDGVIDSKDRVYLGSNIPRYTYGFNLNLSYKNFDFASLLQGVGKVSVNTLVLEKAPTSTDGNFKVAQEDSWTPTNTDATFPRLTTSTQNYQSSSYWIKSGAYLRVKSIQLGYTINPSLIKKVGLTKLRLYVSGQNLFTFSSLPHDIDPETPTDFRYYPQVKVYTFGLNADF